MINPEWPTAEMIRYGMSAYEGTDQSGPWRPLAGPRGWYVGKPGHRSIFVGRAGAKRINYFDRACEEAARRNKLEPYPTTDEVAP